jgi:hypothetical protein
MLAPKLIAAGVATLALGAGTGIAAAAMTSHPSPVDSSGVIHGCWTDRDIHGSHVFTLQDAGTKCPSGTTAISWNQKGPAGPSGSRGPAGGSRTASWPSSLDQLNGIPCNQGTGTTHVSYSTYGAVSITCTNPRTPASPTQTPTPTQRATPSSSASTAEPTAPAPESSSAPVTPDPTYPTTSDSPTYSAPASASSPSPAH